MAETNLLKSTGQEGQPTFLNLLEVVGALMTYRLKAPLSALMKSRLLIARTVLNLRKHPLAISVAALPATLNTSLLKCSTVMKESVQSHLPSHLVPTPQR
jgi:hypothetical protein